MKKTTKLDIRPNLWADHSKKIVKYLAHRANATSLQIYSHLKIKSRQQVSELLADFRRRGYLTNRAGNTVHEGHTWELTDKGAFLAALLEQQKV